MVIAGHNGAGKTTCYETRLKEKVSALLGEHINPDEVEKEIRAESEPEDMTDLEFSRAAQEEAELRRNYLLEGGTSFSFETVGSHEGKVAFIKRAREAGYVVALLFVGLDSPEKSRDRVALRVTRGGHNVPTDKIFGRYPRVIENMRLAVREATLSLVVDNSTDGDPVQANYRPVALYIEGRLRSGISNPPAWTAGLADS
jgi:predicted ABC-type ATPase